MFQRADDGFSLVEVLMAMFLLTMLALAVLPLLIGATQLSVANRDLSAATAFANAQLAPIKTDFPLEATTAKTCGTLRGFADSDIVGPDGIIADIVVNACPTGIAAYPTTVPVTVTVVDERGDNLVTLTTRIPVGAP